MKYLFYVLLVFACSGGTEPSVARALPLYSAESPVKCENLQTQTEGKTISSQTKNSTEEWFEQNEIMIQGIILSILLLGILQLIYAPIVLFFRPFRLSKPTVQYLEVKRAKRPENLTEEEADEQAWDYMAQAFHSWTVFDKENHEWFPTSIRQIRKSRKYYRKATALAPGDPDLLKIMNEFVSIHNYAITRRFNGSFTLITVVLLTITAVGFFTGGGDWTWQRLGNGMIRMWVFYLPVLMYIFCSFSPRFMGNIGRGEVRELVGASLAGLAATPAFHTVETTWSDGSKTRGSEFNGEFAGQIVVLFGIAMILAFALIIWSSIKFFRNYVFYI